MLDADTCITLLKSEPEQAFIRLDAGRAAICISTIVLAELLFGVEKSVRRTANRRNLDEFVSLLTILPFSELAAEHYGNIRADLERVGKPIGNNDLLIAAHARSAGLTLVTNNRREFDRVPGLRVENWLE